MTHRQIKGAIKKELNAKSIINAYVKAPSFGVVGLRRASILAVSQKSLWLEQLICIKKRFGFLSKSSQF